MRCFDVFRVPGLAVGPLLHTLSDHAQRASGLGRAMNLFSCSGLF